MAHDALVVGAGPAGAIAALVLARAGVAVRLIDRARFPRHKLCGDTVNPGALSILDRLPAAHRPAAGGAPQSVGCLVRERALPVTGMTVTGPGGERVAGEYPAHAPGAAIGRHDLDRLLIDAALAAGAELEEGVRMTAPLLSGGRVAGVRVAGACGDRTIHAQIVIAADGRRSRLAAPLRTAGFARQPRRWAFGRYYTGVAGLTTHGEMHVRRNMYVGVSALPGGMANLCVVRELARGARMPADPAAMIAEVIASEPLLRERFAAATPVGGITTLGPLAVDVRGAGVPGLLLAGDAAGFIDPMTGDGLRFAFRGGELAAEAALSELATGAPAHAALHAARTREFARKWRVNRVLRGVAGSPRALMLVAAMSAYWSLPVRCLIGMAGDLSLVPRPAGASVPPQTRDAPSEWQPVPLSRE